MRKLVRYCGMLALLATVVAAAGAQQTRHAAGRIGLAFGGLAQRAAETSDVSLDGAMLQVGIRMLSAKQSSAGDAQAQQILSGLEGVYVKSFRFDARGEYSAADLAAIHRQLRAPGWSRIMSVHSREDSRRVEVYVMATPHGVGGMVIIAAYPRELRVVNLVGPIDPAALSRLGGHFGIPRVNPRSKQ